MVKNEYVPNKKEYMKARAETDRHITVTRNGKPIIKDGEAVKSWLRRLFGK